MLLQPDNAPIMVYHQHNHHQGHDIEIGAFLETLRQRGSAEGTSARTIEIIRDLDVQDLRLNIQPRVPAPPMHVRGVRRPRGRGRQMLERPGPAGLIPRVADNLNAFGNNY